MPTIPTTKTGWYPIGVVDLRRTGEYPGQCDRCDRRNLRYLHTLEHPTEGQVHVGSECAKRICYGYAPEREERRLRRLWARRSRWLIRNWATSWNGNPTLKFKHDGKPVRVTVFVDQFDEFSYCIDIAGERQYPSGGYPTVDAAKLGAFDRLADACEW